MGTVKLAAELLLMTIWVVKFNNVQTRYQDFGLLAQVCWSWSFDMIASYRISCSHWCNDFFLTVVLFLWGLIEFCRDYLFCWCFFNRLAGWQIRSHNHCWRYNHKAWIITMCLILYELITIYARPNHGKSSSTMPFMQDRHALSLWIYSEKHWRIWQHIRQ